MIRYASAVVTVLITVGAWTRALSCGGKTCRCQGDVCMDCSGTTPAAPAPDAGDAESDGNSAEDVGGANDGGPGCISGCSRNAIACASSDPPVGWRCDGPGITSSAPFLEAGCTSLPINSIAWCCPSAFLSQCACTPGRDSTCNDDPAISSLHGTCRPDGTCSCILGPGLNPATGRCR